jgi:hypothetical protein
MNYLSPKQERKGLKDILTCFHLPIFFFSSLFVFDGDILLETLGRTD